MKRILFIFGLALTFSGAGSISATAQTAIGPKLSYTSDVVNYGEVEHASNGERSWTFKNEGSQPLTITYAKGSCGCTIPEYPKEPIMPGKEGVIKIKYDTKRSGPIARTVELRTNEPEGSNAHIIQVKGHVKEAPPADSHTPANDARQSVPAAH